MARNKPQHQVAIVPRLRPGEGAAVHMTRQTVSGVDGNTVTTYQVDMAQAPVPDRKYVADAVGFVSRDGEHKLIFAQSKLVGSGYRSMLVVHFSEDALNRISQLVSELEMGLRMMLKAAKVEPGTLVDFTEEPAQTVGFAANIIAAGYASREGTMDFYNTSSFGWDFAMKKGETLPVDPIVRISLPSRLLLPIFDKFMEFGGAAAGMKEVP